MRHLMLLFHLLPKQHSFQPTVLDSVTRGLNNAANKVAANGYAGTWVDAFAREISWVGPNKKWHAALNISLNAAGRNGAPEPGVAVVAVLEQSEG
ncbi:MAG: hypothetical protein AAFP90_00995 [Planctomycetota bacterium]